MVFRLILVCCCLVIVLGGCQTAQEPEDTAGELAPPVLTNSPQSEPGVKGPSGPPPSDASSGLVEDGMAEAVTEVEDMEFSLPPISDTEN